MRARRVPRRKKRIKTESAEKKKDILMNHLGLLYVAMRTGTREFI
jgi:hypothetical protein